MRELNERIFDLIADEIEWEGMAMGIDDLIEGKNTVWLTLHEEDEGFRAAMKQRGVSTMKELVEEHINEELTEWPCKVSLEADGDGYAIRFRPECPECGEPTDQAPMSDPETDEHIGSWWFCTACDWERDMMIREEE